MQNKEYRNMNMLVDVFSHSKTLFDFEKKKKEI